MNLKSVLEELDLLDKGELFYLSDIQSNNIDILTNRVKESLLKIKPDAFFCINDEPLVLFFENPDDLDKIQRQVWNFNQSPAIIINENNQWIVKNGFKLLENKKDLETITNNISDFEYFKIVTGKTWMEYKHYFENKNRVDVFLLSNIEVARNILINKGNLHPTIANSLIGRIIFIRYLIDKKVELNKYQILEINDFYNILSNIDTAYNFFHQIREDFNGNLFPLEYKINGIEINEKDKINEFHLSTIISLLKGDKLSHSGTVQKSLFDIYDFSIIPIEFISNVYERFIGAENQAKSGAYYTPLFLVDYIQKETVTKYFDKNPTVYNCKVLDPACGSGIFLVETLRQIISQYKKNNPNFNSGENYTKYKDKIKQLLLDNIFGIDKDENAISVAIFSLYITLLDNLTPRSIVGFKFPELINKNFFINDFFDTDKPFNEKLNKHHFQFILGNPPWATSHDKKQQIFEKYIERRAKNENSKLEIENREISEAFLVRVSDFDFKECSLIVTSKILYKTSRKKNKKGVFRKYFLNNFKIRQVFELSSVRHKVFSSKDATAPATILFYSKCKKETILKKNIINHISLKPNIFFNSFRLMVIEKFDSKNILQHLFVQNDWLWKILVYGNVLDYFFIKRLKSNNTIYDYITNEKEFIFGKGISIGGGDKNNIEEHKLITYSINSKKKALKPYIVSFSKNILYKYEYIHRPRNINLFKAPILLVGKGVDKYFMAKSAIANEDVIYTDAITGIKPLTKEGNFLINLFLALFNSELFSYYITMTNSSVGVEREQIHDKDDKFSFPIIKPENLNLIKSKVTYISDLFTKLKGKDFNDFEKQLINDEVILEQYKLNLYLFELYELTKQERSLIEYNSKVIIPLLKGDDIQKNKIYSNIDFKDVLLEDYAKVYFDHFGNRFNNFEVEIIYSRHTILMKFKVISEPSIYKDSILWKKEGNKELLKNISKLTFENLSTALYIQKDIKGFEKDFFYVAKPNQYKSWHPAIAHLDLSEFIEALHNFKTTINE